MNTYFISYIINNKLTKQSNIIINNFQKSYNISLY